MVCLGGFFVVAVFLFAVAFGSVAKIPFGKERDIDSIATALCGFFSLFDIFHSTRDSRDNNVFERK